MAGFSRGAAAALADAGHIASEAVAGIRTVAAFGLQPVVLRQFAAACAVPLAQARQRAIAGGLGLAVSQFVLCEWKGSVVAELGREWLPCRTHKMTVLAGSLLLWTRCPSPQMRLVRQPYTSLFTAVSTYALAFYVGAQWISSGVLDFQSLFRAFFAITLAAQATGRTNSMASDQSKADAAKRSIFALIDAVPRIDALDTTSGAAPAAPPQGAVEFRDVHFSYPTRPELPVLRGVSFSVPAGYTVALVGESGSGKSTVIALLERWYDVTGGAVLLDGVDVRALNVAWLREQEALVVQEPPLFSDSVAYNIEYGRRGLRLEDKPAPNRGVPVDAEEGAAPVDPNFTVSEDVLAAARAANAHDLISSFAHGYATHCGDRGSQLSGGQKQRVAIARAIIRRARILL
jgi:ATP-binding cassette subfamily B (MDR/TAP) protein 1